MENGKWGMEKLRIEDGEWRMEKLRIEKLRMEDGKIEN